MNTLAVSASAQHDGATGVRFQINCHAALAAIDVDKHRALPGPQNRRQSARRIAFRAFDLDHVRTQIGKDLRCIRPHQHAGKVQHLDTGEWAACLTAHGRSFN